MAVTVPSFIPIPWAQNGQTATIPQTTAEQGRASWDQGFPQVCALPLSAGGIPPNYLDFQGIFNALSASIFYMQTGALWPWSSTLTYPLGAHVLGSNNNEYVAVQENTGQDPTQDSTGETWQNVTTFLGTAFLPLSGGTMTGALTLKGDPTASLQAATKQYVDNRSQSFIGMIAPFASKNLPEGWMICDGSSVLFADWPEFQQVYNEGRFTGMTLSAADPAQKGKFVLNGSTGVYLPDLTGLFIQASAAGTAGAYVAPGLPNITGFVGMYAAGSDGVSGAFKLDNTVQGEGFNAVGVANNTKFDASSSDSQYGASDTVQPPAVKYVLAMYLGEPDSAAA